MSTRTRFEKEAKGNSEIVHWLCMIIQCSFKRLVINSFYFSTYLIYPSESLRLPCVWLHFFVFIVDPLGRGGDGGDEDVFAPEPKQKTVKDSDQKVENLKTTMKSQKELHISLQRQYNSNFKSFLFNFVSTSRRCSPPSLHHFPNLNYSSLTHSIFS